LPRVVAPPLPKFQKLDSSKDGSFVLGYLMRVFKYQTSETAFIAG